MSYARKSGLDAGLKTAVAQAVLRPTPDNAPLSMVQGACLGLSPLNGAVAWKIARLDSFKMRLVAQVIAGRW